MSSNQELFIFDQCYTRPAAILEANFNATLINSYNKYLTPNAYECEKKASIFVVFFTRIQKNNSFN